MFKITRTTKTTVGDMIEATREAKMLRGLVDEIAERHPEAAKRIRIAVTKRERSVLLDAHSGKPGNTGLGDLRVCPLTGRMTLRGIDLVVVDTGP